MCLLLSVPSEYSQLVDVKGKTNHLAICDTSDYVLWQQTRIKVFFFLHTKASSVAAQKESNFIQKKKKKKAESLRLGHWSGRKSRSAGSRAATREKNSRRFQIHCRQGNCGDAVESARPSGRHSPAAATWPVFFSSRSVKSNLLPFRLFGGALSWLRFFSIKFEETCKWIDQRESRLICIISTLKFTRKVEIIFVIFSTFLSDWSVTMSCSIRLNWTAASSKKCTKMPIDGVDCQGCVTGILRPDTVSDQVEGKSKLVERFNSFQLV